MRRLPLLPLAIASVFFIAGCGPASSNNENNNSVEKCVQGRTLDCSCPGGTMGVQTCNAAGTFDACQCEAANNTSTENNTSVTPGWEVVIDDYNSLGNKMDYLWVLDNSFSMCQEQDALRDSLDGFIDGLVEGDVDFHIGLTTTHAPESGFSIEPVAVEANIQSTPQPIPGNNEECLRTSAGDHAPVQKALENAKRCLANPEEAVKYEWNDAQIECALFSPNAQQSSGCVQQTGLADVNGDTAIDLFDLFPPALSYRTIPKVLRAEDYRDAQGMIDRNRLRDDLFCISIVGTRGDGYEKGLRVAVEAVSPALTGGALGAPDADPSKPNHGLIRKDAAFSLMFLTDENDCSHDGSLDEAGNVCRANVCEYYNSTQASLEDNPLVPPADLAATLRANLAATKGLDSFPDKSIHVSSIHGTWQRFEQPFPTCEPGNQPEVEAACSTGLGEAFSGDRYERFMRDFPNHYPNAVTSANPDDRLDFSKPEPVGLMCEGALEDAVASIGTVYAGCIRAEVFGACSDESACGDSVEATKVCTMGACTSNLELTLAMDYGSAIPAELEERLCVPDTMGVPGENTCVISASAYEFKNCGDDDLRATWRNGIGIERDEAERAKIRWMKRQ